MKTNTKSQPLFTNEGAKAKHINPEQQLRRSVMSCMLWESEFYEDGESITSRIAALIPKVPAEKVRDIAMEARSKMKLRHVPLLIARVMASLPSHRKLVAETLAEIIQRADELPEFVSIYWKEKRQTLSAQVKKGLAKAFTKFSAYQLAKYNRDGAVKLRDVLFLCHAKPKDTEQEKTWKQLIDGTLPIPDTWEVALSSGQDKKEAWTRLIQEKKLGGLAMLRNLRNMQSAKVEKGMIREGLSQMDVSRVLPFRFIAAARYAPDFEPELESAMFKSLGDKNKLAGVTGLMVDVSGSMDAPISSKSDLRRIDAACGLAMVLREICQDVVMVTFSQSIMAVPPRRGFALRDAIASSQPHGGTYLGAALKACDMSGLDRLIVITDEQSHDTVPDLNLISYMINVASCKNGVGYGAWTHIDGFSEAIVDYILAGESRDVD